MLLVHLAETSRAVSGTSGRRRKIQHLARCLRDLEPDQIEIGTAFLAGEPRQGRIGVGPALLEEALPEGAAAQPELTLREVDEMLERIAATSGPGSQQSRQAMLGHLLARATRDEQPFLTRLLLGELRQGALEGLMVEAIAQAAQVPVAAVRRAYMLAGELAPVAGAALRGGGAALAAFEAQPLEPVRPMLAQVVEDMDEALSRLGEAAVEYKLDGARVQVHKAGKTVRVFSRRMNDVTEAVPELVEVAARLSARSIVLDGETMAMEADGMPLPFQTTMRRFGRRLDVARMRRDLPLAVFFFDCLYLDGASLIDEPGRERLAALDRAVAADDRVPRIVTGSPDAAGAFARRALEDGHEGVMVKSLAVPYEAGSRGAGWLKVKPFHTLDLVVLAAEWGHGRRRGWLSNLHLGAREIETGQYRMLGKTFKGLTDRMLTWQTQRLLALEVARDEATVYVRPELVVEVAFNDVQRSPHYDSGVALRFARVKAYRTDKPPEQADTLERVQEIAAGQPDYGGR